MTRLKEIGLLGTTLALMYGCGTVIGLSDYEIDESLDEENSGDGDGDGDEVMTGSGGRDGSGGMGGSSSGGNGSGGDGSGGDGSGGMGTGGTNPDECPDGCDDDNDCTTDNCVAGACSHVTVNAGEPCSGGVCNGTSGMSACVRCIDDQAGDIPDAGCGDGAPRCNESGTAICTGCESHADCDDDNDCTQDSCSGTGECVISAEPAGTSCSGGVCNGLSNAELCEACIDDQSSAGQDAGCGAGAPICDDAGANSCEVCVDDSAGAATDTGCSSGAPLCETQGAHSCVACVDDAGGLNVDTGCDSGTPACVGGSCVECINSGHCDDGVACTTDTCNNGSCQNTANNSACSYNSSTDKCGVCNPSSGCEDGASPTLGTDILTNGNFDTGAVGWIQESTQFGADSTITTYAEVGVLSAHSSPQLAWLGGGDGEETTLTQIDIPVPANAVGLRVQTYYYFATNETPGEADFLRGTLRSTNGSFSTVFHTWPSEDSGGWTVSNDIVDISTWTGNSVELEYYGYNNDPPGPVDHTNLWIDTLSVRPRVCQ